MTSYNHTGEQTLIVSTTAVGLTLPTAASRPTKGLIYVGGQPVRYRADGTNPTSTSGMFVPAGAYIKCLREFENYSGFFERVKFIRDTTATGDATLEVEFNA